MRILKWIYAKMNLALALLIHLGFKKWVSKKGVEAFLSLYAKDQIFPLTHEQRKTFASHSNCINCGLCVSQCEAPISSGGALFYQTFMTPAHVAFSYSRMLSDNFYNQDFLKYCSQCRACEKVCPTGVPLTKIIEFVQVTAERSSRM